ncbi:hypothetical protein ACK4A2_11450 [Aeromonas veronii]
MIVDAISSDEQLTQERLLQWHRWLFPADDRRLALFPKSMQLEWN